MQTSDHQHDRQTLYLLSHWNTKTLFLVIDFRHVYFCLTGTGIKEPIPIEVKTGRTGVGHEKERCRKRAAYAEALASKMKYNRIMEKHQNDRFRKQLRSKHQQYDIEKDLYSSQKVCEQLDIAKVHSSLHAS